jgi:hypothetical protein
MLKPSVLDWKLNMPRLSGSDKKLSMLKQKESD